MFEQVPKEDIFNMLRVIADDHHLTQRDLSHSLGFSLGKTNYLLKALAQKGYIKIRDFSHGEQRIKRIRYIMTPRGLSEKVRLTHAFLKRKEEEYLALKREWSQLLENKKNNQNLT
jgi:EPS-associated MarR family transcriptional regulator